MNVLEKTDKREQIINAAIELFARNGFDGTSIRDIAQLAGVNIAMINYYFGTKEKLFEKIIEYKVSYTKDRLTELYDNHALGEMEKMEQVVDIYIDRIFSSPGFHRILHQEIMLSNRPGLKDEVIQVLMKNKDIIQRIIRDGIDKKIFREVDPQLTIATLVGSINQVVISKSACLALIGGESDFDPYTDDSFRQRVSHHLKMLMRAHLSAGI